MSIWTVAGRMRGIPFACSPDQLKTLVAHRKGESDLVCRGGKWFLIATCDLPDPEVYEPVDWIGVDRGIVNLATTSDGTNYQGRRLSRYRRWQARKRAELQRKGSRSARRRLARRKRKEQRHATHVNHRVSKEIVSAIAYARRGCLSPHPHPPPDSCWGWVYATRDRPVVGGSRERDEVCTTERNKRPCTTEKVTHTGYGTLRALVHSPRSASTASTVSA
ncbi:transposase [Streptomyces antimycoticus]|uniref:transposase n=1 Tax=Streptomyces antimycoticus TaxID=68175 RepID=UPI001F2B6239|nr:transposase [Streptomyces antimycoticus]